MDLIGISICLTDIPKGMIKQAKNGKKYINLCLSERKKAGEYGETHTLFVSQTKEERASGAQTVFVGSGKAFAAQAVTLESIDSMPPMSDDNDLPF
jgi:hypothetical protein